MDGLTLVMAGLDLPYFEYYASMLTIRASVWHTSKLLKCPGFHPSTASNFEMIKYLSV
jgi:hypothetical protein